MYVPVVSLSKKDDDKLLNNWNQYLRKTIKLNKNRSQMTIQTNNNNLNYWIDPTFAKVNRLFVLSSERIAGKYNSAKDHRDCFSNYYLPNVEKFQYFN